MRPVGAIVLGAYIDRIGRRSAGLDGDALAIMAAVRVSSPRPRNDRSQRLRCAAGPVTRIFCGRWS